MGQWGDGGNDSFIAALPHCPIASFLDQVARRDLRPPPAPG